MKQTLRDIKSAWPRERRFTWRGWVLVGVFVVLAAAAWRGWDPVLSIQYVVMDWFGENALRELTIQGGVVNFWDSVLPVVSFSTLPGLCLAIGLVRPARSWWWFVALFLLILPSGFGRHMLFQVAGDYASQGVFLIAWAVLLGFLLRTLWASIIILLGGALATAIMLLIASAGMATQQAWTFFWVGYFAWGPGQVVFNVIMPTALAFIALRSWHVPPDHLCRKCHYDRRGLNPAAPCPECGTAASVPPQPPAPAHPI